MLNAPEEGWVSRVGRGTLVVTAALVLWLVSGASSVHALRLAAQPVPIGACFGEVATIVGTAGNDQLDGTPGSDVIAALGGDDKIRASAGRDRVCAGAGDDIVSAQAGGDRASGGSGDDQVLGGDGADRLVGGKGTDGCTGGKGVDTIRRCERRPKRTARRELKDAPPMALPDSASLTEDEPAATIAVLANDSDADSGPMLVVSAQGAAHGSTAVSGDGSVVTYSPKPDYCGPDSFAYSLNGGSTTRVSLEVACVEDPARATPDEVTLTEDDPAVSLNPLANDFDVDGGPIAIADVGPSAHGQVTTIDGGPNVTYLPEPDFCGLDSFVYTLLGGSKATVAISVTCVDDAPLAVGDAIDVPQNALPGVADVFSNDTDIDAGPLTILTTSGPAHGTVQTDSEGHSLTYTPDLHYCNDGEPQDTFTYTLNGGSSATVSVTVPCAVQSFSSDLSLSPEFDPAISDYAVRCNDEPLNIEMEVGPGHTARIDDGAESNGLVEAEIPLTAGEEFSVVVSDERGGQKYFVRCLPSDFPPWTYDRLGHPSHRFYVVAPTLGGPHRYVVIFDEQGVPLWWYRVPEVAYDAKVLPTGLVGWTQGQSLVELRDLDGSLVRTLNTVQGLTDIHELQELPSGNFLLMSYPVRKHVDLTAFGGGPDESVIDGLIEEIDPDGNVVWSWNSKDHIGLEETGRWYSIYGAAWKLSGSWDVVHMNAIEPVGEDAVMVSMRHDDAIYKIDKATGAIVWKLGGTETPQSLTVEGDPEGAYPLGGQHDVRLQSDGTITIYDNNTLQAAPPRAVRYEIDEAAGTANFIEQVADPEAPVSECCGSARRSEDGSWLMSWGGRSLVTEFDAEGDRTFRLTFGGTEFSYRAVPVADGLITVEQLRAGMDTMFPH